MTTHLRPAALGVIAASVAMLTMGGVARGDTPPGLWDLARQPELRRTQEIHAGVSRLLVQDPGPREESRRGLQTRLERARAVLTDAGAAKSSDLRLRFDLGRILHELGNLKGDLALYAEAADVLKGALALAPDHPMAASAWGDLSLCLAHLHRPVEERDAGRAYVQRSRDEVERAHGLLNLAEAEMRVGNLDDAVADYEESMRLASRTGAPKGWLLAAWGLAVALDRAGNPHDALTRAASALAQDPKMNVLKKDPSVFYEPAWEVHWYLGLGELAAARAARSAALAATHYRAAEGHWSTYVAGAARRVDGAEDRWLPLAKAHLEQARAARGAAERRAGGPAAPLPSSEEPPF